MCSERPAVGASESVTIGRDEYTALRQASAILREIRRTSPLSYFIFGLDGEQRVQSDNLERLTGWRFEEVKGEHVARYARQEDMAVLMRAVQEAVLRPGEPIGTQSSVLRKDGTPVHTETHVVCLEHDPDIGGILGLSLVVDRQRQLEEENRELKSQVARMQQLDAVGTLASGIAHDFNNVLQAVLGNADLALSEVEPGSELASFLEGVVKAGHAGKGLATKLLTYVRKRPPHRKVVDAAPCVRDAIDLLRIGLPPGVTLETSIPERVGYFFDDAINIHQLVLNLGTNAGAAAAAAEGGTVRITLEEVRLAEPRRARLGALRAGRYAKLTVLDTGPGMDDDTLVRVFDPFFTTKSLGQGTGLGLAVVAGIVELQGGALDLESKPERGTVFDVYVPLISDEEARAKRLDDVTPDGLERVAVIDDDPGVLFVARTFLERLGYRTTHFQSARAFLEALEAGGQAFDVVVTDLGMPGMSGIQLARYLADHHPHLVLVLTSGFDDPLQSVKLPAHVIQAVLRKPYGAADIGRAIRRAVDHKSRLATPQDP